MAENIASLQFRADTGDINKANSALDTLADKAEVAERAADNVGNALSDAGAKAGSAAQGVNKFSQEQQRIPQRVKPANDRLEAQQRALEGLLDKLNPTSKAFDDLDASMAQLSAAKTAGLLPAEQFADYANIIERQRDALQRTQDELTGYAQAQRQTEVAEKSAARARETDIAALSRLRAVLDPAAEAAARLKDQYEVLNRAKAGGFIDADTFTNLKGRLDALTQSADDSTVSAGQLRAGWGNVTNQLLDLGVQLQGGASPITALIQQGPQLATSFGSFGDTFNVFKEQIQQVAQNFGLGASDIKEDAGEMADSISNVSESINNTVDAGKNVASGFARFINPTTVGIGILVSGVAYLGYQAYKTYQQNETLNQSIAKTGNIANTSSKELQQLISSVAETADASQTEAFDAVNRALSLGVATDQIKQFSEAALQLSESTGQGVDEVISQFSRIGEDPVQALIALNDQYNFANVEIYNQVKALTDNGDKAGATRLIIDALSRSQKQFGQDTADSLSEAGSWWEQLIGKVQRYVDKAREAKIPKIDIDYRSGGAGSAVFDVVNKEMETQTKETAANFSFIADTAANTAGFVQKTAAAQKQLNKDSLAATIEIEGLQDRAKTNADRRTEGEAKYRKQLAANVITQEQYNSAVKALNELYKDPKARTPRQKGVQVDSGDKLTEQYQTQNIALDAQIKLLRERGSYETNVSQQRKNFLELEAKYSVLEEASRTRNLTKQEQQMLASKDQVLAEARVTAEKGDQLAAMQRQVQVNDELTKMTMDFQAQAKIQSEYAGMSTREMQKQVELAKARAAVLAKGGTDAQAQQAVNTTAARQDLDESTRTDWISASKTALADWADSASNYAAIARDAITKGMDTATDAVANFALTGKLDFASFTKSVLSMIVQIISQLLVMQAVKAAAGATGFGGLFANAKGGVYSDPSLSHYTNGVYSSPQMFQFQGRSQFAKGGVFGEAGPEAIMPLTRDNQGRLGVRAEGASGTGVEVNTYVTVNSDGSVNASSSSTNNAGAALGQQMSQAATDVVRKALLPGGDIWRIVKGR